MVRNGDSDGLVWLSEFGAPTGTSDRAVSPDRQAQIVADAVRLSQEWEWVGPLLLYSGRDSGPNLADAEDNFGIVTLDFRPKPALDALPDP
jgi:hypothetical protein